MGFWRWVAKYGTYGQTARTIGRQFAALRARFPERTQRDILREIAQLRHAAVPYTNTQRTRIGQAAWREDTSLEGFVMTVVLAESNLYEHDVPRAAMFREVVREELARLGLR